MFVTTLDEENGEGPFFGERPDSATLTELNLINRAVGAMSPDLLMRHRTFVGATVAVIAASALIVASIAIKRRRDQGIKDPEEIQRSITPELLAKAALSVLHPFRWRPPRRKKAKKEPDN